MVLTSLPLAASRRLAGRRTVTKVRGFPSKAVWLACEVCSTAPGEVCSTGPSSGPDEDEAARRIVAAFAMFISDNHQWRANRRRNRRPFNQFAATLDDREFGRRFRLNRQLFNRVLSSVKSELKKNESAAIRSSGSAISPEWRLAITLRMLAVGDPSGVADMANVSDVTVWPLVAETVRAINRQFPFDKFDPMNSEHLEQLETEFALRSGNVVRGCVGAVDGMAVCVRKPRSGECGGKPLHYYNRKGFYAANLQAVCDAKEKFLLGSIRCPGSTEDSTAFGVSWLGMELDAGQMLLPYWIAGDAAYRATEFMVVPWPRRNLDTWKDSFNFWHSKSRDTIECAFGMLTMRWGILSRPLSCSLTVATQVVFACMILHNLCIDARLDSSKIEYMRGDGSSLSERVPILETGGRLWADQTSRGTQGRRSDHEVCPRRAEITNTLQRAALKRPVWSISR